MNHKLHEAMNDISDRHLLEAETYRPQRFPYWIIAAAAVLALAISLSLGLRAPNNQNQPMLDHSRPTTLYSQPSSSHTQPTTSRIPALPTQPSTQEPLLPTFPVQPSIPNATTPTVAEPLPTTPVDPSTFAILAAAPTYPKTIPYPKIENYPNYSDYRAAMETWSNFQNIQYNQPDGYADSLTNFFADSLAQFLQGDGNTAYSPLNVYMAMAMLAETTGGNSRQQILDLFGVETIEELRTQAGHVWNAHYSNDGKTTLTMANSLWLSNAYSFHQHAADNLAQYYYASTFHGNLGSDAVNQQLQAWLNENTGGLLKDQANNVELPQGTVFALASTIYFSANWTDEFFDSATYNDTFYTPLAPVQTPFMHRTNRDTYYRGTHFGAISLRLEGSNRMWLILPDEGHTPEEILQSDEYLRLTMDPSSWSNRKTYEIHLSLPKFDVTQQQDLIQGMQKLGIADVFNPITSDFSPLTAAGSIFVSQINHATRVTIDEEGCTAAAFTVIAGESAGTPNEYDKLEFNLNRPFLFIVSSRDNLPLFAGIVKAP